MNYIYQCYTELIVGICTIIIYFIIILFIRAYNYITNFVKDVYKLKQNIIYNTDTINIQYCQLKYLIDYQIDHNKKYFDELKKMINHNIDQNKKQYDELYRCIPPFNVYLGKQNDKPIYCLHNIEALKLSNDSNQIVKIDSDFSKFCKLRKLFICNYYCNEIKIISETLEWLRIYNGEHKFVIPNIVKTPNLKHIDFFECSELYGLDNLLDQLNKHPNKKNIEIVFKESPYFDNKIEEYKKNGIIVN
jgi:hypothetical protein